MSLEELATLVRLLDKHLEMSQGQTHNYVKQTRDFFNETYEDSDPDEGVVKEF